MRDTLYALAAFACILLGGALAYSGIVAIPVHAPATAETMLSVPALRFYAGMLVILCHCPFLAIAGRTPGEPLPKPLPSPPVTYALTCNGVAIATSHDRGELTAIKQRMLSSAIETYIDGEPPIHIH